MKLVKHIFLAGFLAGSGAPFFHLIEKMFLKAMTHFRLLSHCRYQIYARGGMELEETKNVRMKGGTEPLIDGVSRKPQLKQARDFFVNMI